jgi:hypothetical protein
MNTLPTDQIEDRLMVEVHYYSPYQFCLMKNDEWWGKMFYYWGEGYHHSTDTDRNANWGEEDFVEDTFNLMKNKYTSKGIPVLLGEFGAFIRTSLTGDNLALHRASREYYHKYIVQSAINKDIIPVYWDNGVAAEFRLFDRNTGAVTDQGLVTALMEGVNSGTSLVERKEPKSNTVVDFVTTHPNPASDSSEIRLFLQQAAQVNIHVVNILGQKVAQFNNLNFNQGINSVTWNSKSLPTGTYFIKVNYGQNVLTKKILIAR